MPDNGRDKRHGKGLLLHAGWAFQRPIMKIHLLKYAQGNSVDSLYSVTICWLHWEPKCLCLVPIILSKFLLIEAVSRCFYIHQHFLKCWWIWYINVIMF